MPLFESVRLAFSQLRAQKLKSALTLLGVVISITFLVTVVSIIEGVNVFVKDSMATLMAANSFELRRNKGMRMEAIGDEERRIWHRRPSLTDMDVRPVAEALPPAALWSAYRQGNASLKSAYGKPISSWVMAVSGDYFRIERTELARGRPFAAPELVIGASVTVIGSEIAERMFGALDPIERELRINGDAYRVVGVVTKKGSLFGESLDRVVYIPLVSPARRSLSAGWNDQGSGAITAIKVLADDPADLALAQEDVRQIMRIRHRLHPAEEDDFELESSEAGLEKWNTIKGRLIAAAAILPGIGLIIGALVIMNVMLVVVTERTREIGIRKAIGASRWNILSQFLVESATVSTIGAGFGILGGILAAKTIAHFSPLPAAVALWSIPAGLALGAVVGIAAGVYPASRAARLDPINALGHES